MAPRRHRCMWTLGTASRGILRIAGPRAAFVPIQTQTPRQRPSTDRTAVPQRLRGVALTALTTPSLSRLVASAGAHARCGGHRRHRRLRGGEVTRPSHSQEEDTWPIPWRCPAEVPNPHTLSAPPPPLYPGSPAPNSTLPPPPPPPNTHPPSPSMSSEASAGRPLATVGRGTTGPPDPRLIPPKWSRVGSWGYWPPG